MHVGTSANEVEIGPFVLSDVRDNALTDHSCPLETCIPILVLLSGPDSSASLYLLHFVLAGFGNLTLVQMR